MSKIEPSGDVLEGVFKRLGDAATNLTPLMERIGEYEIEVTKQRFSTSTDPDGNPWAPNTETTYLGYLDLFKRTTDKKGRLNQRGVNLATSKKPLIGETKALSTGISYRASDHYVKIGSPQVYAGVQQEGAKAHSFTGGHSPWGDIPARRFLGFSSADIQFIERAALEHLDSAAKGS